VTRAPVLVIIIHVLWCSFFLGELRCVAFLYVAVSHYLPFVLSLLTCGCWGSAAMVLMDRSAAMVLMDTSGFSRAQGVGVYFHLVIPASGTPRLLLGLLLRASGRCVFSGLGCVRH
jgi:hypothetical protein